MNVVAPTALSPPASSEAPPVQLAVEGFGAALACFAIAAAGLVLVAPDLANGTFYLPRVVATVHLVTLGWIVLSIFGALSQFLPVAVGRSLRSPLLARFSLFSQALGIACFVPALLLGARTLLFVGAGALSLAFVSFAVNCAVTLAPVRDRSLTWWALAGAVVFLLATPAYGVVLAIDLHDGGLADRFGVVARHAHVAIVGFVLLVVVGVAHRLLPMFLLSHGASECAARISIALLFGCASLLTVPARGPTLAIALALGCGGVAAFIVQAFTFHRHRKRKALDPGMRLAGAGVVSLALAVLLAPFALTRGLADLRLLTTYFVLLLGGVSLFVAGHYYKIVPFLVWNHRYGPLIGTRKVPKVGELFSEKVALVDAALLVTGVGGLAVSTLVGSPLLARAAAIVFAAGAWLEVVVIARLAHRKVA